MFNKEPEWIITSQTQEYPFNFKHSSKPGGLYTQHPPGLTDEVDSEGYTSAYHVLLCSFDESSIDLFFCTWNVIKYTPILPILGNLIIGLRGHMPVPNRQTDRHKHCKCLPELPLLGSKYNCLFEMVTGIPANENQANLICVCQSIPYSFF